MCTLTAHEIYVYVATSRFVRQSQKLENKIEFLDAVIAFPRIYLSWMSGDHRFCLKRPIVHSFIFNLRFTGNKICLMDMST